MMDKLWELSARTGIYISPGNPFNDIAWFSYTDYSTMAKEPTAA